MNLLKETKAVLHSKGKKASDVLWCGSEKFGWFSWRVFRKVADVEYDSGYGAAEVAVDLLVVGTDFWLERGEYDGSEWWEFKEIPTRPQKKRTPQQVSGGLWCSLCESNKSE